MKILLLISFFVSVLTATSKANMDCIYTSSKKGITISYTSPCFSERYQQFIDSFLNKIINDLNRTDTSLKILVSVNYSRLSRPNTSFINFYSIAYDTLRFIDDDYISRYYFKEEESDISDYSHFSKPIDINSSLSDTVKSIGIKIIYRLDYRLGQPNWSDVMKLIFYSAGNLDEIKSIQKRDTVRYDWNGWYVSLLTVDTTTINKILGKHQLIIEHKSESSKNVSNFWLLTLIGLVLSVLTTALVKKHRS